MKEYKGFKVGDLVTGGAYSNMKAFGRIESMKMSKCKRYVDMELDMIYSANGRGANNSKCIRRKQFCIRAEGSVKVDILHAKEAIAIRISKMERDIEALKSIAC